MITRFFLLREWKRYPLFFLLVIITLLLGSLGLSGIGLVTDQVQGKLKANAKELLTSDLVVSARRDLFPIEKKVLETVFSKRPHQHYRVVDIYSMATSLKDSQSRLVEIRGFEAGFPFYGKMHLRNVDFNSNKFYISKDLAELWSVDQDDELKIGDLKLQVMGVVEKDSSQGLRGFSLAPRVYLPLKNLEETGLLRPGSTGSFAYHYRLPQSSLAEVEEIKQEILKGISDAAVKVTLPEEGSEQTARVLNYISDFMALAALIGLVLSLVGVFYLYQSHLGARLKDLCLLHLHGLSKGHIVLGILLQFTLVFVFVFLLQLIIVSASYKSLAPVIASYMGIELDANINLISFLKELPLIFVLSISVLIPLLMGLLRTPMGLQLKASRISLSRFHVHDFAPFALLLWAYSCYLCHSLSTGSLFFGALILVLALSTTMIKVLQFVIRKIIFQKGLLTPNIEYGISLRNLARSGHKLTLSFLSLAMGATLISLILQLDSLIQKELTLDEKRPALFLFDIQEEQLEDFKIFSQGLGVQLEGITPMIRARLEKVNGKAFTRTAESSSMRTREDEVESRFRNRGINLTYRGDLTSAEKIIEGKPFPEKSDPARDAFVSLEKRFAQRMGLVLGDEIIFDVQGVEVKGVVRNFREVKWTSFYPNFFVNVEPGYLDEAPKTYLAVLPSTSKQMKRNFQRASVLRFPNISFIDVEETLGKMAQLFTKSRQAIELISWLSLGVGFVILYGLSHDQVYRRYYDLALMKSLGLTSKRLRIQLLLEFGTLFAPALFLGLFLGWAIAMAIAREVFKLELFIDWYRVLWPGILLSVLCLVSLIISSWKAIQARPKELLSEN